MRKPLSLLLILTSFMTFAQEVADSSFERILLLMPIDVYAPRHLSDDNHAGTVIRIERKQIEKMPVQTLNELLEYSMSLDVRQRGPMDVQADLSLRGSTFDQVLVMLNGHPLNDPQTGHHNMDLPISLADVEAVEILYGGASIKYGPYAFAGSVNFITKIGVNANEVTAEIHGGSYGYNMARIGLRKGNDYNGFTLQLQRSASDGYIDNTDFEQYNAHLQYDVFLKKLALSHLKVEAGFNSKDFGAQNFYTTAFPKQFEATRTAFLGASFKMPRMGKIELGGKAFARRHWDRFELFRETGGPYEYSNGIFFSGNDTVPSWYSGHNYHQSDVIGGDVQGNYENCIGITEVGLDIRYESVYSNVLGEPLDEPIDVPNSERGQYFRFGERTNFGIYGRHEFDFKEVIPVIARVGLRYNSNTAFGDEWLPSAEVEYPMISEQSNQKIFASWNRAFRLPTYTDLYYNLGGAVGSIDLTPEYSSNYELGYSYETKERDLELQANLFRREGKNLIDWVVLPDDPNQTLQAANITELNLNGAELNVTKRNTKASSQNSAWLRYGASFTYMFSDDDEFAFESLYALDYLRFKMNALFQYKLYKQFRLNLNYSFQQREGQYTDVATSELVDFDAVHILDARVEWFNSDWRIYMDGSNLLNQQYVDRANVVQPGFWFRSGVVYRF